jgi:Uma2 family endonuclease
MLTCDQRDKADRYVKQYYKLIVEVLSDSTEAFDRGRKFEDYRRAETLEEYVLVSQDRLNVEIYRLNAANRWELQVYQAGDVVEFASLGVNCKIETLYRGVELPPPSEGAENAL